MLIANRLEGCSNLVKSPSDKIEKFKPTFENGGFWEYYRDLERQFEDFLEYVPYFAGNKGTYSFRLANLMLNIGAHIDSAFKEVAKYPLLAEKYPDVLRKVTKGEANIVDYFFLANEYSFSEREIIFKCLPARVILVPYKDYVRKGGRLSTPNWWRVYNKVKHEFSDNFQKATLRTTRDALAGAFLINACHIPSAMRLCEYGYLQGQTREGKKCTRVADEFKLSPMQVKQSLEEDGTFQGFVETPLFIYNGWKG